MTQDEALAILKTGANVFLTGEPGSGKTHTISRYVAWLRERGIEPSITASTGIAATHIGGMTIHSWSGIGIEQSLAVSDIERIAQKKNILRRLAHARVLVLDEVSMLSARTLSMVEAVCRAAMKNNRPFGGLQVILVGDFFQLPPVSRQSFFAGGGPATRSPTQSALAKQDKNNNSILAGEQLIAGDPPREEFAYHSRAWEALECIVCYLSEQHRQEDSAFLEFLSALRHGAITEAHWQLLRTRYSPQPKNGTTQLYSHNTDVDAINTRELAKLPGNAAVFAMEKRGPEKLIISLKRGCLSPESLSLKIGARVMFTKNDLPPYRYANGTLGTVTSFSQDGGYPIIATNTGTTIIAEPDEWRMEDGGRILARIAQVPLRLAWAMTVHKSQGMSLDAAHMDLANAFEYGQGYVALSRVRTLAGLSLAGLNKRALEVHPDILAKDAEFRALSAKARETFAQLAIADITRMHDTFVKACGGREPEPNNENNEQSGKIKNNTQAQWQTAGKIQKKGATLDVTFELLKKGTSIVDIAAARGLAQSTIYGHIFQLHILGRISRTELEALASVKLKMALPTIYTVFNDLGTERLTPVFDKLQGAYSFDDLRLARVLFDSEK